MNTIVFTVAFPFIMAFLLLFFYKNKSASYVGIIAVGAVEFAAAVSLVMNDLRGIVFNTVVYEGICGLGFSFKYTGLRGMLGALAAFAWFIIFLFSKDYSKNDKSVIKYYFFNMVTFGAVMGVFFAADFYTLYFFFEIMSLTSFIWMTHKQTRAASYAAETYLGITIAGGMAVFTGLFIIYRLFGTLNFDEIANSDALSYGIYSFSYKRHGDLKWLYTAAGCMFAGFGAGAGVFPMHVWVPMLYTETPSSLAALLSAVLNKAGMFGIILVSVILMPNSGKWGIIVFFTGVITIVFGGIRSIMSDNLKTALAYSSMSQIGFVPAGIGMQELLSGKYIDLMAMNVDTSALLVEVSEKYAAAVNGTVLYIISHSLSYLLLFMAAGVILTKTKSFEFNKIQGFGKKKPFLLIMFLAAAAGVCAVPLFDGYIKYLFWLLNGLTVCCMAKIFVLLFIDKNTDRRIQADYERMRNYAAFSSKTAMALCVMPALFIGLLPDIAAYGYGTFAMKQLKDSVSGFLPIELPGMIVSVLIGLVLYFMAVRIPLFKNKEGYKDKFPKCIDMEKIVYRTVFYRIIPLILGIISRILDSVVDMVVIFLRKTVYRDRVLSYELLEGNRVTHTLGRSMEKIHKLVCTVRKQEYKPQNYEHKLALKNLELFERVKIFEKSLLYGIFVLCVGLGIVFTILYVIIK